MAEKSKKIKKGITIPVMKKDGKKFFLLSSYDDSWIFEAYGIFDKPNETDPLGHSLEKVSGKGGAKCAPKNDKIFEVGNAEFEFIELPIITVDGKRYVKLSHLVDTWNFTAKSVSKSKIGPKDHYKRSGHGHGTAKGEKQVKCYFQKDIKLKDLNF